MTFAGMAPIELLLYPVLITIWIYAVHQIREIANELYGSEFTVVAPHFFAANVLILLVVAAFPMHVLLGGGEEVSAAFIYGMTAVQAAAGLLYAQGMYKTYTILFATEGFMADDAEVVN